MNNNPSDRFAPTPRSNSLLIDDLVWAYKQDKKGVRLFRFDGQQAAFLKFRPHSVLSFGLAYEDSRTNSVRFITSQQEAPFPFVLLYRSHKSTNSACIAFHDGTSFTSDDPENFAAFFSVKFQELETPALYTISKWGDNVICTDCYSANQPLPIDFCCITFALLGGAKHDNK